MGTTTRAPAGERVVVADFDVICALGTGREALWRGLVEDAMPAARVTRFDASLLPVNVAAEVTDDLHELVHPWGADACEAAAFDRKLELQLACATLCRERFLSALEQVPPERRGIMLGVGLDVSPVEKISKALSERGALDPVDDELSNDMTESLAGLNELGWGIGRVLNPTDLATILLAHEFGCGAFQDSVLTACSSSSQAIGLGFAAIRRGDADAVVVGGTDSLLNLPAFAAFAKLGVIQPERCEPSKTCRPFDRGRRGTLLGEGAGLMLLISASHAERIGSASEIELLGYANTLDGYHITSPDPSGEGMRRAMEQAMTISHLAAEDLDYVNFHGTGTRANDPTELLALSQMLGEAAGGVSASSTKDRHGHLIAAAGIVEAAVVLLSMMHDLAPRTVNLERPIDGGGVDLVMHENRARRLDACMTNSFAFGGINSSLVFGRRRS